MLLIFSMLSVSILLFCAVPSLVWIEVGAFRKGFGFLAALKEKQSAASQGRLSCKKPVFIMLFILIKRAIDVASTLK